MESRTLMRLTAAALLAALVTGCGGAKRDATQQDAALLTQHDLAAATRADLGTGVPVQGTLEPSVDVMVIAPFPEILDAVLIKEGQAVRKGQVLARFRLESIGPAAASAEAQRRIAASEAERMRNLFKEGAVSQRDLDNAEAGLKAAEAMAAQARKRLEEATVTAAFDGVVAERLVQSGNRVGDGDPLFRLVNTDELEFAASVPTEALGQVRPGAAVALTVSGLDGVEVAGRVARVNTTVDAATRQVKVYVTVPNRDHRLAGDLFASGRIVLDRAAGVLAIPSAGVRVGPGGTKLAWVIAAGKAEQRQVTLGIRDELLDLVEVRTGLAVGDQVVVSPVEGLSPGQPVQVTDAPAAASPAAAAPKAGAGRKGK
jgi:membrane fusion protein (multidrug efflux system)